MMKKAILLFLLFTMTQAWSQSVILTDSSHNSDEVMRFDQVSANGILFQICRTSNYRDCTEVGTILADDLIEFINEDKRNFKKSGIASVAGLALTSVGLYMGLVQESSLALGFTMMLAPFCQGIPFALLMKNMDQYGLRSQTDQMLNNLQECSLDKNHINEVYNFNMLKNYITNLIRDNQ